MEADVFAPPREPAKLEPVHLRNARLFAHRDDMIEHVELPAAPTIAEIGVAYGGFTRVLIDRFKPSAFHAYDIFQMHTWPTMWGEDTRVTLDGKTHRQFYEDRFKDDSCLTCFEGDSSSNLMSQTTKYDLIYLDGDHSYEGVLKDTEAAIAHLKPKGTLVFNDYIMYDHIARMDYGIVQVVNDLCTNQHWRMTHLALQHSMFCDVVLMRDL